MSVFSFLLPVEVQLRSLKWHLKTDYSIVFLLKSFYKALYHFKCVLQSELIFKSLKSLENAVNSLFSHTSDV